MLRIKRALRRANIQRDADRFCSLRTFAGMDHAACTSHPRFFGGRVPETIPADEAELCSRRENYEITGKGPRRAVVLGVDGNSGFDALHSLEHDHEVKFCAFDILVEGGDDLRTLPNRCERRIWSACWRVVLKASPSIPFLQIGARSVGVQAARPALSGRTEQVLGQSEKPCSPGNSRRHVPRRRIRLTAHTYSIRRHSHARSGRIHREDLLKFKTHGAVAFARRRHEL